MTDLNKVIPLIDEELREIKKEYGETYSTMHECYAVLLEEFDEAQEDFDEIRRKLNRMWYDVKHDDAPEATEQLLMIEAFARHCIAELVQVAAVCRKGRGAGPCGKGAL